MVCTEWRKAVDSELRTRLNFTNSHVPLRVLCALTARLKPRRLIVKASDIRRSKRYSEEMVMRVLEGLHNWTARRPLALHLEHCQVQWTARAELAPLMPCVDTLHVCPESEVVARWASALCHLRVHVMQIGAVMDSVPYTVRSIKFYSCGVRNVTRHELRSWLGNLPVLQEVAFNDVPLLDKHASVVAEACVAGRWTGLAIEHAGVGVLGAMAIAAAVERSPNLRDLSMQGNAIGDVGALAISKVASNIRTLDVSYCDITAAGADAVMGALGPKRELHGLGRVGTAEGPAATGDEFHVWV